MAIESTRMIDIDQFVPRKEIDELYLNNPYYIVPDGEVGAQAFAVIREAIDKEGMVALGRVVFTSREHVIALEAARQGADRRHAALSLRGAQSRGLFRRHSRRKDHQGHARPGARTSSHTKSGHFNPEKFEDRYEDALKDLLKRKQSGKPIEQPRDASPRR